jgi:hypothetical protein
MSFIRDASPRKAGADLIALFTERRGDRMPLLIAACIPPAALMFMVNNDVTDRKQKPRHEITYFESWPASRSREDSLSANVERQKLKDINMARQREAYKALGRSAGIDVDRLAAEAIAEEEVRKAKQAKAIAESMKPASGASK